MERAAVLIDGGYYEKIRLQFNRPKVDLVKFSDEISKPAFRVRTYYFDALPWIGDRPDSENIARRAKKQSFIDGIRLLERFEVRLGRVQRKLTPCNQGHPPHVEYVQKLVDVLLSVEMVRLAWSKHVDLIVVVTGDSDFVPAVCAAKDAGVIVRLVHGKGAGLYVHNEMLMACDERIEVTQDLINTCLRQS